MFKMLKWLERYYDWGGRNAPFDRKYIVWKRKLKNLLGRA